MGKEKNEVFNLGVAAPLSALFSGSYWLNRFEFDQQSNRQANRARIHTLVVEAVKKSKSNREGGG